MRYIIVIFCLIFGTQLYSQRHQFGFQTQLVLQLGYPINKIGVNLNAFWLSPFSQVNIGTQSSFYLTGLGSKGNYIENRAHFGLIGLVGRENQQINQFFNPLFHQSARSFAFGYTYLIYWDNRHTSQRSGAFGLQFQRVALQFENDLFAGQGRDRFRTAMMHAYYMDSLNLAGINVKLWTGETRGGERKSDENYPSKYGYKDLSNTLYGNTSHGILSLSYSHLLPYGQQIGAELGIDDERIRHFFQNKLVHDFQFSKTNKQKHNPHYPMLQPDGNPYLFRSTDSIRKTRIVLQAVGGGI